MVVAAALTLRLVVVSSVGVVATVVVVMATAMELYLICITHLRNDEQQPYILGLVFFTHFPYAYLLSPFFFSQSYNIP